MEMNTADTNLTLMWHCSSATWTARKCWP